MVILDTIRELILGMCDVIKSITMMEIIVSTCLLLSGLVLMAFTVNQVVVLTRVMDNVRYFHFKLGSLNRPVKMHERARYRYVMIVQMKIIVLMMIVMWFRVQRNDTGFGGLSDCQVAEEERSPGEPALTTEDEIKI